VFIGTVSVQGLLAVLPAIPVAWEGNALGNALNKRMNQE